MDPQQILDLYEWEDGVCFRHPSRGEVPTTHVKTIHPRAGDPEEVRACEECVLVLEQERLVAAEAAGVEYKPGRVGAELQ